MFGPPTVTKSLKENLGSLTPFIKTQVKNLRVIFDTDLKFDKQINAVVKASFFQLRTIFRLKSFLNASDHAFAPYTGSQCTTESNIKWH